MSEDTPQKKPARKINLKLILQILAILVLLSTAATNMMVVYQLFAPDTLPKLFYVAYQTPTFVPTPAEVVVTTPSAPAPPVGITGMIAGLFGAGGKTTPTPAATEESKPADVKPGQGIMVDTSTKIVNLADAGGKKFIRCTATLEFAPNDAKFPSMTAEEKAAYLPTFMSEVNSRIPVMDDIIITLLSTKDYQAVYTAEGKDLLRQQIMATVNQRLPEYHVIYVYFKEFVMQ